MHTLTDTAYGYRSDQAPDHAESQFIFLQGELRRPAMAPLERTSGGRPIDPTLDLAPGSETALIRSRGMALSADQLQPLLRQVESELERPLRVADMAMAAGLSLFHFSREFRRVTGISPYAYVRRRRIARSALLLAGSKTAIVEIARMVGFRTHAHFSGAFMKAVGMTPRTYRLRYGPAWQLPLMRTVRTQG